MTAIVAGTPVGSTIVTTDIIAFLLCATGGVALQRLRLGRRSVIVMLCLCALFAGPLVVCGIAQPKYLMEYVQGRCPDAEMMAFADHHNYTEKDIDTIVSRAAHFDYVLTTEKDLQRIELTSLAERLEAQGKSLVVLPMQMCFLTDHTSFDRQIITYVRENCRKK